MYRLNRRIPDIRPVHSYSGLTIGKQGCCIRHILLPCYLFLLFTGLIFIRKDSADGRLLIWRCSAQLIFRKPVSGYGGNGFTANYMNEQSAYFTRHPGSKYAMLADMCAGECERL